MTSPVQGTTDENQIFNLFITFPTLVKYIDEFGYFIMYIDH